MNEPVAYRVDGTLYNNLNDAEDAVIEINHLRKVINIDNGSIPRPIYIEPLYEEIKLHPRMKMTQAEFDEFESIKGLTTSLFTAINLITKTDNYKQLKISSGITNGFNDIDWQNNFAYAFINFTYANPEETIEIVQTEKWFVRSKKEDENGSYQFLFFVKKLNGYLPVEDELDNSGMKYFDTKEEAELWVNPLTEAVQLPVEGE